MHIGALRAGSSASVAAVRTRTIQKTYLQRKKARDLLLCIQAWQTWYKRHRAGQIGALPQKACRNAPDLRTGKRAMWMELALIQPLALIPTSVLRALQGCSSLCVLWRLRRRLMGQTEIQGPS